MSNFIPTAEADKLTRRLVTAAAAATATEAADMETAVPSPAVVAPATRSVGSAARNNVADGRQVATDDDASGWIVVAGKNDSRTNFCGDVAFPQESEEGMTPGITNWNLRDKGIHQLSCGGSSVCALDKSGIIRTWGSSDHGELGRATSTEEDEMKPAPLEGAPTDFVDVASTNSLSLGVTARGQVYQWGAYRNPCDNEAYIMDEDGNFHYGTFHATPKLVHGLEDEIVKKVYANSTSSCWFAETASGKVYSCGPAFTGQLCRPINHPTTNEEILTKALMPNEMESIRHEILKDALTPKPILLKPGQAVQLISCGKHFTLMVLRDSSGRCIVHTAGANDLGQLGNGSIVDPKDASRDPSLRAFQSQLLPVPGLQDEHAVQSATGISHALVLLADGRVVTWGGNKDGELGLGTAHECIEKPTEVHVEGTQGTCKVVAITAGENHSMALTEDGNIYTWGSNTELQTGHGTDEEVIPTPRLLELKVKGVDEPLKVLQMVGGPNISLFLVHPPKLSPEAHQALDDKISAAQIKSVEIFWTAEKIAERIDTAVYQAQVVWTHVSKSFEGAPIAKSSDMCKKRFLQLTPASLRDPSRNWTPEEDAMLAERVETTLQTIIDSNMDDIPQSLAQAFRKDCRSQWIKLQEDPFVPFDVEMRSIGSKSIKWFCGNCSSPSTETDLLKCLSCKHEGRWICKTCNRSRTDPVCPGCRTSAPQDPSSRGAASHESHENSAASSLPSSFTDGSVTKLTIHPVQASDSSSTVDLADESPLSSTSVQASDEFGPNSGTEEEKSSGSNPGGTRFHFGWKPPALDPVSQNVNNDTLPSGTSAGFGSAHLRPAEPAGSMSTSVANPFSTASATTAGGGPTFSFGFTPPQLDSSAINSGTTTVNPTVPTGASAVAAGAVPTFFFGFPPASSSSSATNAGTAKVYSPDPMTSATAISGATAVNSPDPTKTTTTTASVSKRTLRAAEDESRRAGKFETPDSKPNSVASVGSSRRRPAPVTSTTSPYMTRSAKKLKTEHVEAIATPTLKPKANPPVSEGSSRRRRDERSDSPSTQPSAKKQKTMHPGANDRS